MTPGDPAPGRAPIGRGTTRSLIAGLFILVDIALVVIWVSVLRTSPQLQNIVVAAVVTLALGAVCLVAVIVLGATWHRAVGETRPNRSTAAGLLSLVSVVQLVGGFAAMAVLGALSTTAGVGVAGPTLLSAVVVAALGVSVSRHVARTAGGVGG